MERPELDNLPEGEGMSELTDVQRRRVTLAPKTAEKDGPSLLRKELLTRVKMNVSSARSQQRGPTRENDS